jgi:hypothetical protein
MSPPLLASGDVGLVFVLASVVFLVGAASAAAMVGFKLTMSPPEEVRRFGRNLLLFAALAVVAAGVSWLAFVGWD